MSIAFAAVAAYNAVLNANSATRAWNEVTRLQYEMRRPLKLRENEARLDPDAPAEPAPQPRNMQISATDLALAEALGYTDEWEDGKTPSLYKFPVENAFAFLHDTNEVIVFEVDGPKATNGLRQARIVGNLIAYKTIRHPIPEGWEIVTILTNIGEPHITAVPRT